MPPAARDVCLQELERVLSSLHRRLRRESRGGDGLTFAQFHLLHLLETKKGATVTDLAGALGVSLSSVTGLSDRLVKCGLVHRERERADRRVVLVTITPRGEELLARIQKRRQELMNDYFKELTDAEVAEAVRLLRIAEPSGGMS